MFGRKSTRATFIAAALGLTLGLSAGPVRAADTIKIAVPTPLTGSAAGYGENVKAGVDLKIEEINAAGGYLLFHGKKGERKSTRQNYSKTA